MSWRRPETSPEFPPIAIVGQGCVLPGAFTPQALWGLLVAGQSAVSGIPEGRWRLDRRRLLICPAERAAGAEGSLTDRGSWVTGFEQVFDPAGLALEPGLLARLDPLVAWLLHAGRAALAEAGLAPGAPQLARAGAIFGHLAYPSSGLAEYAEAVWLGLPRPDPLNRFNAGLPADLLRRGLGLGGASFTLDAACASSLYAIKLACDRLHAGEADLMLAGGISRIDPLVLHAGFTALGALSPSGRTRPFHAEADGLLPAEGAALMALKRLPDALAAGDRVLAVIRGIGLANDGRSGGLLAPSVAGQARAMAAAFASAGLEPGAVSLVECHATGTQLGDAIEIESMAQVYTGANDLPVGSIKSNFGHLTTASGAAGLLKLVLALQHGIRPPTLHCDHLAEAVARSRFRPLQAAEPWPDAVPRVAAISNFGFGGANAHLLLSALREVPVAAPRRAPPSLAVVPAGARMEVVPAGARMAVVALGARVADGTGLADFRAQLLAGAPRGPALSIGFQIGEIRFPPRDLDHTLPQQLLVLRATLDALAGLAPLPAATGVYVGAQTDAEFCRHGLRLRLPDQAPGQRLADAMPYPLDAAGVVGAMPNIPANRINAQFNFQGPGFTLAAEELSGLRALEVALHALVTQEVEAALVGAVDLSVEPVHMAAMAAVAPATPRAGDAAVVLVLKREADARRAGDPVLAFLEFGEPDGAADGLEWAPYARQMAETFGKAHAAVGLVEAAAAVLAVQEGVLPPRAPGGGATPWPAGQPRRIRLESLGFGGQRLRLCVTAAEPPSPFEFLGASARHAVPSAAART